MAGKFQTKIVKRRFVVTPFTAGIMQRIGEDVRLSIATRIGSALDVNDAPAKPLAKKYARHKAIKLRRGSSPVIRDWRLTGLTMDSLHVLRAGPGFATIGFSDPEADRRAHKNNQKCRQFGMSPENMRVFAAAIRRTRFVFVTSSGAYMISGPSSVQVA